MGNKISYYFQPLESFKSGDNLPALIKLHCNSFRRHGWDVVHVDETVARHHPLYTTFDDPNSIFAQSRNAWEYTRACYMRWLAYAVAGHPFADIDVINYGFLPKTAANLARDRDNSPAFLSHAGAVGLIAGSQYDQVIQAFLDFKDRPTMSGALTDDVNDMNILRETRTHWFAAAGRGEVVPDYTRPGWETATLVHFPFHYTPVPRYVAINKFRPIRGSLQAMLHRVSTMGSSRRRRLDCT